MQNQQADQKKPGLISTISWILYDFANTSYSMNVVTLYFSTWLIIDLGQRDFVVSIANSFSMILVAITMPVLGDWSDWKGKKVGPLILFTLLCISGTAFLAVAGNQINSISTLIIVAILIYIVTNYCYQGGLVFYNALLPSVSTHRTLGRVSGYGVAFGYLGAIVGLSIAQLFVDGEFFGQSVRFIKAGGTIAAFLPTAILFLIFALPMFIFVKDPPSLQHMDPKWNMKMSYKRIFNTLRDTQKYPGLLRFLIAKFFYEDSVQTVIIFMGVYTQQVMGFTLAEANRFFIIVIPSAVVGSAICGILTDHYGPKKTLLGVIVLWISSLIFVISISDPMIFWFLGAFIGALLGSVWTAARPLLVTLVPKNMMGEFFGLYALSGKLAAIVGPLVWSAVTSGFHAFGTRTSYKISIGALALLMFVGFLILKTVPDYHNVIKYEKERQ
jgi:UMF1 family MFS transporter